MSNVDLINMIKKHPYSFCVDVSELNGTARDVLEGMLDYLNKLEQSDSYRSQLLEMGFDKQKLNGMDYEDLRDAFNEMNSAWYDCFDDGDLEDED